MVKVYLAGSWQQRADVKALMEYLEINGVTIAVDWTNHEGMEVEEYAKADFDALIASDVFVLYNPLKISRGKFTEFGIAIANDIPVITYKTKKLGIFGHLIRAQHAGTPEKLLFLIKTHE
jgi:hypothetical protein